MDPVLILSTGRCGSTMISEMVNQHPRLLSLSEFFVPLGTPALSKARLNGKAMWDILSIQSPSLKSMLEDGNIVSEGLYPFDSAHARYKPKDIPPILCVTLPHLTNSFEALFDELAPVIQNQPTCALADQYRFLFGHLCERFNNDLWIERSGGSLMLGAKLIRLFPEAKVVHVFRDGRDTAMSMSKHHNFRMLVAIMKKSRKMGIDISRDFTKSTLHPWKPYLEKMFFAFSNKEALKSQNIELEEFGELWSQMILAGQEYLSRLSPDRFLSLKFEDIQQSPHEKLREFIEFIHPTMADPDWLESVSRMPRKTSPNYLELDNEVRSKLTRACAPGLETLGYSTS